jgi:RNA polymerase primary sigma factor
MDAPAEGEDSDFEIETLEDATSNSDQQFAARECSSVVRDAMRVLDARERDVVERHYGLRNGEPETLQRIGTDWGVTRERVRQLKDRALEKIRKSSNGEILREYTL